QPSRLEYARVVDQNVASAESSQRPGHRHRNTLGLGDIAFQGQGCPALLLNLFSCLRATIAVAVNCNDRSADGRELDRGLPANAACRPCYDPTPIAHPKPVSIVRAHKILLLFGPTKSGGYQRRNSKRRWSRYPPILSMECGHADSSAHCHEPDSCAAAIIRSPRRRG